MNEYTILLFYKYVLLVDPNAVRDWQEKLCKAYGLTGRVIVAREGVNVTVEGTTENTEKYIADIGQDARFQHIHFKKSTGTGKAFRKLSVKVRDEVVTGNLGVCDIDPNVVTGKRLSPEELHEWITDQSENKREFYIIDMRNVYEHAVGKFAGSITPAIENFRDIAKIIKSIAHLKNKTVVTVCTGGIRCEKASGYLITQGFTDVYQLDGGIVSYMEQYPNEHFEGKLYVFDARVTMMPARPHEAGGGFYTDDPKHKVIGRCEQCGDASEHFVNCGHDWCGKHFIICESCVAEQKQKHGKVICVGKCRLRRPNKLSQKIHSPFTRIAVKIKTLFSL